MQLSHSIGKKGGKKSLPKTFSIRYFLINRQKPLCKPTPHIFPLSRRFVKRLATHDPHSERRAVPGARGKTRGRGWLSWRQGAVPGDRRATQLNSSALETPTSGKAEAGCGNCRTQGQSPRHLSARAHRAFDQDQPATMARKMIACPNTGGPGGRLGKKLEIP